MRLPFLVLLAVLGILTAQPPITSDGRDVPRMPPMPPVYEGRVPFYFPPRDDIYVELVTNTRPILVEVSVSSNVIRRTLWYHDSNLRTNFWVMASNRISVTTNIWSGP